jgi:hypothetical protein
VLTEIFCPLGGASAVAKSNLREFLGNGNIYSAFIQRARAIALKVETCSNLRARRNAVRSGKLFLMAKRGCV